MSKNKAKALGRPSEKRKGMVGPLPLFLVAKFVNLKSLDVKKRFPFRLSFGGMLYQTMRVEVSSARREEEEGSLFLRREM